MGGYGRVSPQNFENARKWHGRNFGVVGASLYEILLWLAEVLLVILASLFPKSKITSEGKILLNYLLKVVHVVNVRLIFTD